jgi:hypothetical protein
MAKYLEPFDETKEIFNTVFEAQMLDRYANFKVLADNRQKDIYKVFKANDLVKHMTNNDVVIVINETIFDALPDDLKQMVAEEATAGIHFDLEKDKLIITKGDIQTHSRVLLKFGADNYLKLHETIKLLYSQEKDQEAEKNKI